MPLSWVHASFCVCVYMLYTEAALVCVLVFRVCVFVFRLSVCASTCCIQRRVLFVYSTRSHIAWKTAPGTKSQCYVLRVNTRAAEIYGLSSFLPLYMLHTPESTVSLLLVATAPTLLHMCSLWILAHVTQNQRICTHANPLNATMHFACTQCISLQYLPHCARKFQLELLGNENPWRIRIKVLSCSHIRGSMCHDKSCESKSVKMQCLSALLCISFSILPPPAPEFEHPSEFHHIPPPWKEFHPPCKAWEAQGLRSWESKKGECFDLTRCIAAGPSDKSCFHIRLRLNPDKTLVCRRKVIIGEDTKPIKKSLNFLDRICSLQITAGSFGSKMTDFPFAISWYWDYCKILRYWCCTACTIFWGLLPYKQLGIGRLLDEARQPNFDAPQKSQWILDSGFYRLSGLTWTQCIIIPSDDSSLASTKT